MSLISKPDTMYIPGFKPLRRNVWTQEEIDQITANWDVVPEIKGRERRCVLEKRWRLSQELGVKLDKLSYDRKKGIKYKKETRLHFKQGARSTDY